MIVTNVIVFLGFFIFMEGIAWFTHKYIMHGILWRLHSDHHKKDHVHFFERNDFFFLLFATPGIILIFTGYQYGLYDFRLWAGAGIAFYGLTYFLVHDIFIHQRFKILRKTDNIYFRAIRRAHKMHHKHLGKEYGECFGMLWVPPKYFREAKKQSSSA